ncbi:MAG: homoserine dehydrogenase [Methanomassiliicoccales archaeon Mx-03]|nr:homoserine dehydrogenase [Methanomassiliicoccaceae archaeon DOK]TQS80445.1 MAG: homoserine dehydrogenase [Methanomassiliicoccales archaeon Mx-03]
MIVNAELFVKDLPGQLVGSIEPISLIDGNIMGVMHDRERIVNHRICVNITFEVEGQNQLEALKKIWKSKDIIISKLGSVYQTYTMDYLLIGDIDAMYIEELMNKANSLVTMDAVDVRYSSKTNSSSKRTGLISVKTRSEEDLEKLDRFLDDECRKTNTIYVRGV